MDKALALSLFQFKNDFGVLCTLMLIIDKMREPNSRHQYYEIFDVGSSLTTDFTHAGRGL